MTDTVTQLPDWYVNYLSRGFKVIYFPRGEKGPTGPDAKNWPTKPYPPENYKPDLNVGIVVGHEVSPGRYLVDIDFDWTEGLLMAKALLPRTDFGFGRAGKTISHAFYTVSTPLPSKAFDDVDGKPFVEFRCRKNDGTIGFQTLAPPSLHPRANEPIELRQDDDITHDDTIFRRCILYAIACILLKHLGSRGLLHEARLAAAGFLLQSGLDEGETLEVLEAVARASGNDLSDVRPSVFSTASRLKQGQRVKGKTAMLKALGDGGKEVLSRIRDWLGQEEFLTDEKDKIQANNQQNIQKALDKLGVKLSYNIFAQRSQVVYNGYTGPLEDPIRNRLYLKIDEEYHFRPSGEFFDIVIQDTAWNTKVHPVREYLETLQWDGKPRVGDWLVRYGRAADVEYSRAIGLIFLVAAVRRVKQPGCKFDELVVLESEQGQLKSSALRALCPDEDWFSDDLPLNVDAKQIIERTSGKWIIEASELQGYRDAQTEHLKAMLSRQRDGPVRLAYARLPVEVPRQWIAIGTTNSHTYLTDSTGNRRFWPVRVEVFDVEGLKRDRDQLWAEAAMLEAQGTSIRLPQELWEHAEVQQERRRSADPWEQMLADAFPEPDARVAPVDVWLTLGIPPERLTPGIQLRVSKIMQALGFRRMSVKKDGKVSKGWARGVGRRDKDLLFEVEAEGPG